MSSRTRIAFYHGLAPDGRSARGVRRTLAFIREAATRLLPGDSFLGFELSPSWTFQARRRSPGRYYMEVLNTRTLDVSYAHGGLAKLQRLIDHAWRATDGPGLLRLAPRTAWKQKNVRRQVRPDASADLESPAPPDSLGHGDHWTAIFPDWPAGAEALVLRLCSESQFRISSAPPQPKTGFETLVRLGCAVPCGELAVLLGRDDTASPTFLSTYPILGAARVWSVRIERTGLDYGPFEGVVDFTLCFGAVLRCFDPRFAENAGSWPCGREARVALAALALSLKPFAAAPIRITEGELLEFERQRCRDEGRTAVADALTHLDVETQSLRTLYCTHTDHAQLVGRVEGVRALPACALMPGGWLLDVEAIPTAPPDEREIPPAERVLPVYAFAAALGDYRPQPGDLVQGTVWLQATLP